MKIIIKLLVLTMFLAILANCSTNNLSNGSNSQNAGGSSLNASLSSSVPPSGNFDLSIWSLQLPTGKDTTPDNISTSQLTGGYTSAYFYTDKTDGAMDFMNCQQGITTPNSSHCRTEMREALNGNDAAWAWSGNNTMTVTGMVSLNGGGSKGHITLGQVFNSTDDIPLCEFEYYGSGTFKLMYEETRGNGSVIDTKVACSLNTQYTFSMSLIDGVLSVNINGKQVYSKTPSYSGKQFYFKCGNYDQTAVKGTASTTPYSIAKVYALSVVHPGTSSSSISSVSSSSSSSKSSSSSSVSSSSSSISSSSSSKSSSSSVSSSSSSSSSSVGTIPAAPTKLNDASQTSSSITLTWVAPSGTVTGYNMYRSDSSNGQYLPIASNIKALTYTDTGLAADTKYYYEVTAFNSAGESAMSGDQKGKTDK
jgi:hypothetical protein